MARTPRIAIVGGGIGGLAASLALQRHGLEAIVYEKSDEIGEIGAGVNLSPNAVKTLRALGVEDAALAVGCETENQSVRSWRSGRTIFAQDSTGSAMARYGAKLLAIHRADLLDLLRRPLPDRTIRLDAACTGAEATATGAVARFADGTEIEADVVIGADGIRSVVRDSLFGTSAPRFTGIVCWRGLVPAETLAHDKSLLNMTSWWGPHGHVVHYPVRRGELVNFVAHYDTDAWTNDSWTEECDRQELLDTYDGWNDTLTTLFSASERYYRWALYDRDPMESWGRGRVTMLGDAVHPMLPYLGQGAAMAMEDGWVLAARLARTPDDPVAALRAYERLRMPRTAQAQLGSRHRARENHLVSPFARFRRDLRFAWRNRFGGDRTSFNAGWLYEYDVVAAAEAAG